MPQPDRNFDSRLHDKKFEDAGITIGLPALFGSLDARDNFIRRDTNTSAYFDPGRTAARKIGTIVHIQVLTRFDTGVTTFAETQEFADFLDAGYLTMKKAFDDEALGDYFEAAFPFEQIVWYDNRAIMSFPGGGATPAFPAEATVFSHAAAIDDDNGTLLASHISSVLGGATLAAWVGVSGASLINTYAAYPHKASSAGANHFSNVDVNTDGEHTQYAEAYGRNDLPYTNNVECILSDSDGLALQNFFDGLNPTGLDLKDTPAAQAFQLIQSRHGNVPIPYVEPFDNVTVPGDTPF